MSDRINITDADLDQVVGGFFSWDTNTGIMTYTHKNGGETYHKILNAKAGWKLSNKLHGELVPEDEILQELINAGYIAG